ncbi:ABC transporter ATP-binding protein [Geothermobacter hydrogeniphilus]|uniref:Sugar ABC transporter ATP-binding protein n=1 Tax=Geothermobacter hydrogeniphilus TaxID=1969733 RepID=A0A1X0YCW4_9BACT|nr:ABC transporter ATP-binding protein [Geothermobacter hydrogeniphilus]ORJ62956.1 sugar ABC transporter ATP-binding protein [Geothermobacter hydrogeniphilus]
MPDLLQIEHIRKTFPGVVALDSVSFSVAPGEIHTLLGENGAGKSTLMNILTGLYRPDRGRMLFAGREVRFASPRASLACGIGMVHQHFMLVPAHSVFENILLALDGVPGFFSRRRFRARIQQVIDEFDLGLDLDSPVWKLSIGAQQWIELIKLLMRDCRLLILDEPTAVLTPQESERLFAVLTRLREQGKSVIFISHKMREVMEISDRVTVLKKGRSLTTLVRGDFDQARLAGLMIGDDQVPQWQKQSRVGDDVVLDIRDLSVRNDRGLADLDSCSLELRKGEILGIAGVAGNGQKALAEVLTGLKKAASGMILAAGEDITHSSARSSYIAGIAHIPEDRKSIGIAPDLSVDDNLILKSFKQPGFRRWIFQDRAAIRRNAREKIAQFAIKAGPDGAPVRYLSGGNIQKVIIARELSENPAVLVALYPTRGLDIGSAEYVHKVMADGAARGMSTLLISEDLDELLKICDRIAVMFRGRVVGCVDPRRTTREAIGLMMSGEEVA